jgi:hypothetical protein
MFAIPVKDCRGMDKEMRDRLDFDGFKKSEFISYT